MSKMSQIHARIEELVLQGIDAETISNKLDIPIDWIHAIEDELESDFAN